MCTWVIVEITVEEEQLKGNPPFTSFRQTTRLPFEDPDKAAALARNIKKVLDTVDEN